MDKQQQNTYFYRCPICEKGHDTQDGFNKCRKKCWHNKLLDSEAEKTVQVS